MEQGVPLFCIGTVGRMDNGQDGPHGTRLNAKTN